MSTEARPGGRGPFLILYALAHAGGVVAYVPLLTLLLPEKLSVLAGAHRVEWLAAATFAGAASASVANILFGWLSDLFGTRRLWVTLGLALTIAAYALIDAAVAPAGVVAAVVAYQAALNMMLSPLAAWAADVVPDTEKGRLAGLMGAAPPLAAGAGVVATLAAFPTPGAQLAVVCAITALLVLPLLAFGRASPAAVEGAPATVLPTETSRAGLALLWLSRLLVQVAGSVLFAFLLYYLQSLPSAPPMQKGEVARLIGLTNLLALPVALMVGRSSDRRGRRIPFLIGAGAVMTTGLALMALRSTVDAAIWGYVLFGCAISVFLGLHSVFAMQLLPAPQHRGRDLGVFNLTNTLPAFISPLLAVSLIPSLGFAGLLSALSALVAAASLMLFAVRPSRRLQAAEG